MVIYYMLFNYWNVKSSSISMKSQLRGSSSIGERSTGFDLTSSQQQEIKSTWPISKFKKQTNKQTNKNSITITILKFIINIFFW